MKIIHKIGSVFLVALLIASTGGFSIYRHFCQCAGEVSASVFLESPCEHETLAAPGSCCMAEETPSCCSEKPAKDKKPACHNDDCCQTSILFLKINDSFHPALEKTSLKSFAVASTLLFFEVANYDPAIPALNLINFDLPPPETGIQILLALHQLKLAPPLV